MNFLNLFFQTIANFVRRNPILVLLIVILAVSAPGLLRGIASFIFAFIAGLFLLLLIVAMLMGWRIYKIQRQMQDQFKRAAGGGAGAQGGFYTFYGNRARQQQQQRPTTPNEGDVRVHKTGDVPEKRISGDVGDYVEFEETKE